MIVQFRKKIVENTDPQRRVYNGCNFSERVFWSEWTDLVSIDTKADAEASAESYRKNNPSREYRVFGGTE